MPMASTFLMKQTVIIRFWHRGQPRVRVLPIRGQISTRDLAYQAGGNSTGGDSGGGLRIIDYAAAGPAERIGRTDHHGYPKSLAMRSASSMVWAISLLGINDAEFVHGPFECSGGPRRVPDGIHRDPD